MKIQVLKQFKNAVQELLGIPVRYTEYAWQHPTSFPCAWIELDQDSVWEGIRQGVRKMNVNVYMLNRALENKQEEAFFTIVSQIEMLDDYFSENRTMTVEEKNVTVRYISGKPAHQNLEDNFILFGAVVAFELIY